MNIKYTLFLLLAASTLIWSSCSDDTSDPPEDTNEDVCDDLSHMTYDTNVKVLMDAFCATAYCHAGGAGGFNLTTYGEVKTAAQMDNFLKAIKHEDGASSMPKNGTKLGEGELAIIECWIVNGYKEN